MSIQTFSRRQVVFKLVQKVTRRAMEYTHDFVLNVNMHLRFDITNDIKMKNVKRLQLFRHARSYFMAAGRNLITLHYVVLPLYVLHSIQLLFYCRNNHISWQAAPVYIHFHYWELPYFAPFGRKIVGQQAVFFASVKILMTNVCRCRCLFLLI